MLYRRPLSRAAWASGERGALEAITPARVAATTREARTGRTVTLAAPVETWSGPDNPEPARHRMSGQPDEDVSSGLHFARDSFAMNVHGDADSHIDALCHVIYDGTLHGGVSARSVTADGATALSVEAARDGIVGRGVLLDIPRLRGVPWLEPGDPVTADDLTAAETAQHVRVSEGDLLCEAEGRWSFLCVIAPLRLPDATGSPWDCRSLSGSWCPSWRRTMSTRPRTAPIGRRPSARRRGPTAVAAVPRRLDPGAVRLRSGRHDGVLGPHVRVPRPVARRRGRRVVSAPGEPGLTVDATAGPQTIVDEAVPAVRAVRAVRENR